MHESYVKPHDKKMQVTTRYLSDTAQYDACILQLHINKYDKLILINVGGTESFPFMTQIIHGA